MVGEASLKPAERKPCGNKTARSGKSASEIILKIIPKVISINISKVKWKTASHEDLSKYTTTTPHCDSCRRKGKKVGRRGNSGLIYPVDFLQPWVWHFVFRSRFGCGRRLNTVRTAISPRSWAACFLWVRKQAGAGNVYSEQTWGIRSKFYRCAVGDLKLGFGISSSDPVLASGRSRILQEPWSCLALKLFCRRLRR